MSIMDSTPPSSPIPGYDTADWVPLHAFDRVLAGWWLILLAAIAGGLAGLLIHALIPPLYDSSAIINGSINFNETGTLTEWELDYTLDSLGNLIKTDTVKNAVLEQAVQKGYDLGSYGFRPILERRATRWILRVRHPDPQVSAGMANLWADEAFAQVSAAFSHALRARSIQQQLTSLETCLVRAQTPGIGGIPCSASGPVELQAQMKELSGQLDTELVESRGLVASLIYNLQERAEPPARPTRYGRNSLMAAGCLLGLLVGLWSVQIGLVERWEARRRRA